MKLIIDAEGVKRELNGNFSICGTGTDLRRLARSILDKVGGVNDIDKNFDYGWVEVFDPPVIDTSPPNTPPKPWKS